jgi:hypothetical protein
MGKEQKKIPFFSFFTHVRFLSCSHPVPAQRQFSLHYLIFVKRLLGACWALIGRLLDLSAYFYTSLPRAKKSRNPQKKKAFFFGFLRAYS